MGIDLNEFINCFNEMIEGVKDKKLLFSDLRVIFTRCSGEDILAIMDENDNVIDYMKWE